VTFPDGTSKNLALQAGVFRLFESYTNEAALEGARPAGSYIVRFNQSGEPERVIAMTLPVTPAVIPKIANYAGAQTIDATKDFTLQWNSFSTQAGTAVVRLVITDEFGDRIFLADGVRAAVVEVEGMLDRLHGIEDLIRSKRSRVPKIWLACKRICHERVSWSLIWPL